MKKIGLYILVLMFSFAAKGQITYTPMNAAGYQMKYLKLDSGLALPYRDTTLGRGVDRPGVIVINPSDSLPYYYNGSFWKPVYVDSAGVIELINNKVDSVTVNGNTLFYWVAGLGYGTSLNKLDSIHVSNDSVFTCIAGTCTFAYQTSAGSGTVTQIIAGYGLTGDTIVSNGTLAVDTSVFHTSDYNDARYALISHTHSATDITSGTLPIARGGTGLSGIGSVGQLIRVKSDGVTLEYFTPDYLNKTDSTNSITGYATLYQNSLKSAYVADKTALENYTGNSKTVIMQDSLQGGTFNYVASATPDSGTVFNRYGGGYWQRSYSGAVSLKWFGAKGNGSTNDSTAIKLWFNYCVAIKKDGYAPAGTYNITGCGDCMFVDTSASQKYGTTIYGAGDQSTIFRVNGNFAGKAVIDISSAKFFNFHDIGFYNSDHSGTAIRLDGDNNFAHQVTYTKFHNISTYNFDTSVIVGAGQDVSFDNLNAAQGNTAFILGSSNVFNLSNSVIVGVDTGMVINGGSNTVLSSVDLETSNVGIAIHTAGSVALNNCYWESNAGGNILAGTVAGDNVSSLKINGGALSSIDSSVIDRVNYFSFNGTSPESGSNSKTNIRITSNTNFVEMPPRFLATMRNSSSNPEYIMDSHKNNQTSFPYYSTDLRNLNQPAWTSSNIYLDTLHNIYAQVNHAGTMKDTSDYLTGGKALIFKANSGVTTSDVTLNFLAASIPTTADKLNVVYGVKYNTADTTTHTVNAYIIYKDTANVTKVYSEYLSNGVLSTYKYMLGQWATSFISYDLKKFRDSIGAALGSITSLQIDLFVVSGTTSTGNESVILDNVAVYPARRANTMYSDNMYAANKPYISNPKNLLVDNQAILPTNTNIGTTTSTELGYVHGLISSAQTQLNARPTGTGTNTYLAYWTGSNILSASPFYISGGNMYGSKILLSGGVTAIGTYAGMYFDDANASVRWATGDGVYALKLFGSDKTLRYTTHPNIGGLNQAIPDKQYVDSVRQYAAIPAGAIANGTTATTQATTDSTDKISTDKFVKQLLAAKADTGTTNIYADKGALINTALHPGSPTIILDSAYIDSTVRAITSTSFKYQFALTTQDLNTTTTTGWYSQGSDANAASSSNYPVPYSGRLEVWNDGTFIYQFYQSYSNYNQIYYRSKFSGTWSAWHRAATANYNSTATSLTASYQNTIEVTATGQTITLPTAVGISGKEYTIKLTASGSATVATTSSQTIDGSTTYSLGAQYKYVTVQSNGSNWIIIGNN